ncbi:hypothetical protein C8R47DRAFT_1216272 [Mycena vitilis]|nr:hypothetical protein C8R47DRAFT_1216272 [Mycena vitilis]
MHPCLPNCDEIPAYFWDYWRSIQPADRLRDEDTLIRSKSMDWSVLRDFSGKNGLLQVVMILLWWGARAHQPDDATGKKDREQVAEWELAVDDVRWVFTAMVDEGLLSKKRAASRGFVDKPAPPKKRKT